MTPSGTEVERKTSAMMPGTQWLLQATPGMASR